MHCEDTILHDSCNGFSDLTIDAGASPPQARMGAGEATLIVVWPVNADPDEDACVFESGSTFSWGSSDPDVVRVDRTSISSYVVLRALAGGDAEIFADGVSTPAGAIRTTLSYCPEGRQGAACRPVPLALHVLP